MEPRHPRVSVSFEFWERVNPPISGTLLRKQHFQKCISPSPHSSASSSNRVTTNQLCPGASFILAAVTVGWCGLFRGLAGQPHHWSPQNRAPSAARTHDSQTSSKCQRAASARSVHPPPRKGSPHITNAPVYRTTLSLPLPSILR